MMNAMRYFIMPAPLDGSPADFFNSSPVSVVLLVRLSPFHNK